jgi:signal transduction histidine kinase
VSTCALPTPQQTLAQLLKVWGSGLLIFACGFPAYGLLPSLLLQNDEQVRWAVRVGLVDIPVLGGLFVVVLPWVWYRQIHQVLAMWANGQAVSRAQCVKAYELALRLPWRIVLAALTAALLCCVIGLSVVSWQAHLPLVEIWKALPAVPLVGGMAGAFCYFGTARALHPVVARCSAELRHARPVRQGSLGTKFLTMTCLLAVAALCLLQPAAYTMGQVVTERYVRDRALMQLRFAAYQTALLEGTEERLTVLLDASVGARGYVFAIDDAWRLRTPHPRGYTHLAQEALHRPDQQLTGHEGAWTDRVGEHRVIAFMRMADPPWTFVSVSFPADFDLPLRTFVLVSWWVVFLVLCAVFLFGRYYTRSITSPLAALTQAARQIAERGDLSQHVPVTTTDEISEVARAFNRMVERLQASKAEVDGYTRRLERSSEDLAALNQEMEELLHVVSHDLRAPLINIQGFSKRLERDVEGLNGATQARFGESLLFISKSVEKMDTLLSSLLAVSRVGRKADPLRPNDLDAVLDDVLTTCDHQLRERSIRVIRHPLPKAVPCRRNELNQVFSNLMANAIAYMGETTHRVIEVGGTACEDHVECFVRDTGIGIDPVDHERIFQMFTRLEAIDTPGDGIGLAYVRRILRSHGGRIWVESRRGEGSTFFFTLPTRAGVG